MPIDLFREFLLPAQSSWGLDGGRKSDMKRIPERACKAGFSAVAVRRAGESGCIARITKEPPGLGRAAHCGQSAEDIHAESARMRQVIVDQTGLRLGASPDQNSRGDVEEHKKSKPVSRRGSHNKCQTPANSASTPPFARFLRNLICEPIRLSDISDDECWCGAMPSKDYPFKIKCDRISFQQRLSRVDRCLKIHLI